ncbi:MAG: hypothetical protein N2749_06355 [Clostridia bacterium]|nr:hypothetical protein [Clostridia bacterium]
MYFFALIILNSMVQIIVVILIIRLNIKIKRLKRKLKGNYDTSINISGILQKELKLKKNLLESFTSLINQYFN